MENETYLSPYPAVMAKRRKKFALWQKCHRANFALGENSCVFPGARHSEDTEITMEVSL